MLERVVFVIYLGFPIFSHRPPLQNRTQNLLISSQMTELTEHPVPC